jgi:hypothetical protein
LRRQGSRHQAPRTIQLYSQSVPRLGRWRADHGREPVLDELTRDAAFAWLAELAELAESAEPSILDTRSPLTRWQVLHLKSSRVPTSGVADYRVS